MRVVKRATLVAYWERHPQSQTGLVYWHKVARKARWACLPDVRATFPQADQVKVGSGRTVVVFNVGGNKYRLVTAIHYNKQMVFTLMVLSHAEYSRGDWKDVL
jgi:mRNA interferase HigB